MDDLLLCASSEHMADEVIPQLIEKFCCVDMGEITWCLGMRPPFSMSSLSIWINIFRQSGSP